MRGVTNLGRVLLAVAAASLIVFFVPTVVFFVPIVVPVDNTLKYGTWLVGCGITGAVVFFFAGVLVEIKRQGLFASEFGCQPIVREEMQQYVQHIVNTGIKAAERHIQELTAKDVEFTTRLSALEDEKRGILATTVTNAKSVEAKAERFKEFDERWTLFCNDLATHESGKKKASRAFRRKRKVARWWGYSTTNVGQPSSSQLETVSA